MIPSPLTEDEAVDLALFTLAEALREQRPVSPNVDVTHLVKALFKCAEDANLPITRCWFKFGQFVPIPQASPEHFAEVRERGIGSISSKVSPDLRRLLRASAARQVSFFLGPLNEFLPDYYRLQAPPKYSGIYTTNFELYSFCNRLVEAPDHRGTRTHYSESARTHVTKFHRAVAPYMVDPEARSLVVEFTTLIEELIIRYDGLNADTRFALRDWTEFFSKASDEYVDKIWTLPAAQIAAETMTGPRAEEERDGMLHTASMGDRYRREFFDPLRDEAEERGYLPTEADLEGLVSAARQKTSRADAIEELSYLTRKGD